MNSPIDLNQPGAPMGDWDLIDEQRDFLVVYKPPRLLSVPGIGPEKQDCLIRRVMLEFPEARIVHRLDWDTSGLLLLARNARAHSFLSQAFANRTVDKTYRARIDQPINPESGSIDLPIGKDFTRPPRYQIDHERGRPSLTHYETAFTNADGTTLILKPITGRSHQLRVHLLACGHPIQGDSLYHPNPERHTRLMLAAEALEFPNPENAGQTRLHYKHPADFPAKS